MPKRNKLDFNLPMTRELISRIIDKEMEMEKQPEERKLALHYMTQMVEQGYTITNDPKERYTIQEMMDMTYAYLDGYHHAARTLGMSLKKLFDPNNCQDLVAGVVFSHLATGTVEAKLTDGVMAITRY